MSVVRMRRNTWRFAAKECLELARKVRTPMTKSALQRMAVSYSETAKRLEDMDRKKLQEAK